MHDGGGSGTGCSVIKIWSDAAELNMSCTLQMLADVVVTRVWAVVCPQHSTVVALSVTMTHLSVSK